MEKSGRLWCKTYALQAGDGFVFSAKDEGKHGEQMVHRAVHKITPTTPGLQPHNGLPPFVGPRVVAVFRNVPVLGAANVAEGGQVEKVK